jgi:hypothetical protein
MEVTMAKIMTIILATLLVATTAQASVLIEEQACYQATKYAEFGLRFDQNKAYARHVTSKYMAPYIMKRCKLKFGYKACRYKGKYPYLRRQNGTTYTGTMFVHQRAKKVSVRFVFGRTAYVKKTGEKCRVITNTLYAGW